jgi:hypothetical protein
LDCADATIAGMRALGALVVAAALAVAPMPAARETLK